MSLKRKKLNTLNSYSSKLGILELCCWILLIIYMIPFYLMFINSFKTRREIFENTVSFPKVWDFSNCLKAIERMDMLDAFKNSLIITALSLFLIVLFSSMAA